ncbi:MAG: hypothetical protein KDD46_07175 [Bdellovibrionales bacterium]|nr:hypothetical protein [Bdellovibrionales bacterium]
MFWCFSAQAQIIDYEYQKVTENAVEYYQSVAKTDPWAAQIVESIFLLPPHAYTETNQKAFSIPSFSINTVARFSEDIITYKLSASLFQWMILIHRFSTADPITTLTQIIQQHWPNNSLLQTAFFRAKDTFYTHKNNYSKTIDQIDASVQTYNSLVRQINIICTKFGTDHSDLRALRSSKNFTTEKAKEVLFPNGFDNNLVTQGGYDMIAKDRINALYPAAYAEILPYWYMLTLTDLASIQLTTSEMTSFSTHIKTCVEEGSFFTSSQSDRLRQKQVLHAHVQATWIQYKELINDILDESKKSPVLIIDEAIQTAPKAVGNTIFLKDALDRANNVLKNINANKNLNRVVEHALPFAFIAMAVIPFLPEAVLSSGSAISLSAWVGFEASQLYYANQTVQAVENALLARLIDQKHAQEILYQMKSQMVGSTINLSLAGFMGANLFAKNSAFHGTTTSRSSFNPTQPPKPRTIYTDSKTPRPSIPKGVPIQTRIQPTRTTSTETHHHAPATVAQTATKPKVTSTQAITDQPIGYQTIEKLTPIQSFSQSQNMSLAQSRTLLTRVDASQQDLSKQVSNLPFEELFPHEKLYVQKLPEIEIAKLILLGLLPYDAKYQLWIDQLLKGTYGEKWKNAAQEFITRRKRPAFTGELASSIDHATTVKNILDASNFLFSDKNTALTKDILTGIHQLSSNHSYIGSLARRWISVESLRSTYPEFQIPVLRGNNPPSTLEQNTKALKAVNQMLDHPLSSSEIDKIAEKLTPHFAMYIRNLSSEGRESFVYPVLVLKPTHFLINMDITLYAYFFTDINNKPFFMITDVRHFYRTNTFEISRLGEIQTLFDMNGYNRRYTNFLDKDFFLPNLEKEKSKEFKLTDIKEIQLEMMRETLLRESIIAYGSKTFEILHYYTGISDERNNTFLEFNRNILHHYEPLGDQYNLIRLLYYIGYLKTIKDPRFSTKDLDEVFLLHLERNYGYNKNGQLRIATHQLFEHGLLGPFSPLELLHPSDIRNNLSGSKQHYRSNVPTIIKQNIPPDRVTDPVLEQIYASLIDAYHQGSKDIQNLKTWILTHGFPTPRAFTKSFSEVFDQSIMYCAFEIEQEMKDKPELHARYDKMIWDRLNDPSGKLFNYIHNSKTNALHDADHFDSANDITSIVWAARYLFEKDAAHWLSEKHRKQLEYHQLFLNKLRNQSTEPLSIEDREITFSITDRTVYIEEYDPVHQLKFMFSFNYSLQNGENAIIRSDSIELVRKDDLDFYHSKILNAKYLYDLMFAYFKLVLKRNVTEIHTYWKYENDPSKGRNYFTYRHYVDQGLSLEQAAQHTFSCRQFKRHGYAIAKNGIQESYDGHIVSVQYRPLNVTDISINASPKIPVQFLTPFEFHGISIKPAEIANLPIDQVNTQWIIPIMEAISASKPQQKPTKKLDGQFNYMRRMLGSSYQKFQVVLTNHTISKRDFNDMSPYPVFFIELPQGDLHQEYVNDDVKTTLYGYVQHDLLHIDRMFEQYFDIFYDISKLDFEHQTYNMHSIQNIPLRTHEEQLRRIEKRVLFYEELVKKVENLKEPQLLTAFYLLWFMFHETGEYMQTQLQLPYPIMFFSTKYLLSIPDDVWMNLIYESFLIIEKPHEGNDLPSIEDFFRILDIIKEHARSYRNLLP